MPPVARAVPPPPDAFRDVHGGSMHVAEGSVNVHDGSVDDAEGARHPHDGIMRAAHGKRGDYALATTSESSYLVLQRSPHLHT